MKNLCAVFLFFAVATTGYSQTQQPQVQPPAGPSLDFTLNYIKSALSRGTVSLGGKYGTVLTWSYEQTLWNGVWREDTKIDLLKANPNPFNKDIYCPTDSQGNLEKCAVSQGTVIEETDEGRSRGVTVGMQGNAIYWNAWQVPIVSGQDPYKVQDFKNALTHLIALIRYQYQTERNSELQQEQQQNQGDPFAKP